MLIKALHNQTLLDVAILHCGTVEAVADIAVLNNISITGDLVPGQLIELPANDYGNQEVVKYFVANKIDPATDYTQEIESQAGIGTMIIGSTFKVAP